MDTSVTTTKKIKVDELAVSMAATQAEVNAMTSTNTLLTPNINKMVLGTEQNATSGTEVDFTGIPAGTRRITILGSAVSTNGTSPFMVQLGDSGGFENTGYTGGAMEPSGGTLTANSAGFLLAESAAIIANNSYVFKVILDLENSAAFRWVANSTLIANDGSQSIRFGIGAKALSAELTQVRITTSGGVNTFDGSGVINVILER